MKTKLVTFRFFIFDKHFYYKSKKYQFREYETRNFITPMPEDESPHKAGNELYRKLRDYYKFKRVILESVTEHEIPEEDTMLQKFLMN